MSSCAQKILRHYTGFRHYSTGTKQRLLFYPVVCRFHYHCPASSGTKQRPLPYPVVCRFRDHCPAASASVGTGRQKTTTRRERVLRWSGRGSGTGRARRRRPPLALRRRRTRTRPATGRGRGGQAWRGRRARRRRWLLFEWSVFFRNTRSLSVTFVT